MFGLAHIFWLSDRIFSDALGRQSSQGRLNNGTKNGKEESAVDTVSEWLRRWTRNPLGSARRGSNPLGVAFSVPRKISGMWTGRKD